MPATKKRTEVYVGLFLFIGLSLLGGLVMQFGKFREQLRGHYELTVVFDDASGVIKGSEVRMGGARIGKVANLPELNEAVRVEVELAIDSSIRIPTGASFQINSATLLGDKLIVVVPPGDKSNGVIAPGSRLEGAGPTGLDAIQNNAETVTRDVLRIIKQAEATFGKADEAVADLRSSSAQLREATNKINNSMLADQNLKRFDSTLENFAAAAQRWNAVSSKFEPTVDEAREAIASVRKAADGVDKTMEGADRAIADIKPSLEKIPKAVDQISATTRKAGDALDRIKAGQGLLGALASDNEVALDAKAFFRNLRQYGILRYKDGVSKQQEKAKEAFPQHTGGRRN